MLDVRRAGFTLVEQVVALTILLVIGAALVPQLIGTVDRARQNRAADSLEGLSEAIAAFNVDVRTGTSKKPYPGRLSHLTTPIIANSTGSRNACGLQYTAANAATWGGPYINRTIPANGLPLSIGLAQDQLLPFGALIGIVVVGVTIEDVEALNERFDGDEGATMRTAGSVRWIGPDAQGRTIMAYFRPMAQC